MAFLSAAQQRLHERREAQEAVAERSRNHI
jgi:hypothetical protein